MLLKFIMEPGRRTLLRFFPFEHFSTFSFKRLNK
jgi:hypothetical protein